MAQQPPLIKSLKSLLPETSWPWVIPALMNDPIIWESLSDKELFNHAKAAFSNPEQWSPTNLALLSLGIKDARSIDKSLKEEAQRIIENYTEMEASPGFRDLNLDQSAKIAIGLLNKFEGQNWLESLEAINSTVSDSSGWLAAGAIVYGMVSDQNSFIDSFFAVDPPTKLIPLIVHMLICQPVPKADLQNQIGRIVGDLDLANTVQILAQIKQIYPELAKRLAIDWLNDHPIPSEELSSRGLSDQNASVTTLLLLAEINSQAEKIDQASQSRLEAINRLNSIHSQISNQLVDDSLKGKNIEQTLMIWNKARKTPQFSPPAGLIVQLLSSGRLDDSLTLLSENEISSQTPLHWMNNIYQAIDQEDINQARLFAHQTLSSFEDAYQSDPQAAERIFGSRQDIIAFLLELNSILSELALYQEALQAAQLTNNIKGHNPHLLLKLAESSRVVGEFEVSIEAAEHAVALDPQNPESRRQLAASLESAGLWETSLPERKSIVEHRFAQSDSPAWPTADDLLALAKCSIQANEPQEAIEACQKVVKLDSSNGQAHAILGEALSNLGEETQALEHFNLATQLAPHSPDSWLALSNAKLAAGQRDKAIETLRTASHAVPDKPSILFTLGKIYLEDESLTEAQTAISKAYKLVSQPRIADFQQRVNNGLEDKFSHSRAQHCEIAIAYGDLLIRLGHSEKAIEVYENAYQAYPSYPGLAYLYASALLATGNEELALAPLTIAVAAKPDHPKPYIDYAKSLLAADTFPDQAVQALEDALVLLDNLQEDAYLGDPPEDQDIDIPDLRDLAVALLAQSQAAAGALEESLNTYSQALESTLAKNISWRSDLAIGMGRVALELDQPEIAIAALKEFSQDEIQDTEVAKILTEAYAAISLTQEALYTARSAVHLAPDDVQVLSWFADKAGELGIESEAVPALTSAAQLAPQRTDLVIRLGNVLAKVGKKEAASEAFLSALSSSYASPEDLYQAADGLSDLGDNDGAASCLQRALEMQPNPPLSLILNLANAYESANKHELALKTIDKGINVDPENAHLHSFKADLLSKVGRRDAARSCLEHALILHPNDPQIQLRMAELLREQGELYSAFTHAIKIIESSSYEAGSEFDLSARGICAELARSTLHDSYTSELLNEINLDQLPEFNEINTRTKKLLTSFFCLYAEFALDREEQIAAASALNIAYSLSPDDPRVLGLQSRMAIRQGDAEASLDLFYAALEIIKSEDLETDTPQSSANIYLNIASAGIELQEWNHALDTLNKAVSISPGEPLLHLQIAKTFVLQAEFQRLCQLTDIVKHNPGAKTLSPSSTRQFEEAIEQTINSLSEDQRVELPEAVVRWRSRGLLVFKPNQQNIKAFTSLPMEASDQSALIAAYASTGDLPTITKQFHSITSGVELESLGFNILLIYALSISLYSHDEIGLERAVDAINVALDKNPTSAIAYWVQAKTAELMDDYILAKGAIENALSLWPDEPRWQAFAAHIAHLLGDHGDRINHLEKAVAIEESHIPHYLALGEAHINFGDYQNGIEVLENAARVDPDREEIYCALSAAQNAQGNYKSALKNAKRAAEIAPDEVRPILLNAEILVNMGEFTRALEQVEGALQIQSDHPEALFMQAIIYEELGNEGQALSLIEKAIPLMEEPLPLHIKKIQIRSKTSGLESNLAELEDLAELYPDNPLVLAPFAHVLAAAGRNEESIQAAQKVLQDKYNQLPVKELAEIHHLLGMQLKEIGQLDQSIHQLSEAIRLAPKNISAYLDLGQTQEERREHNLALETYKKAMRIYPPDPRPYYQAGLLLKAGHDYPAAESMLRRAAERAPDDIIIHRQLAGLVAINLVHSRQQAVQEI